MTTFQDETVACASCGTKSVHQVLGSTNEFGSYDLDLRPPAMMRSTMRAWLQECPTCGLVAPSLDAETPDVRGLIETSGYQSIHKDQALPPLVRRFICRALIMIGRDKPDAAFEQMLFASWVADDAELPELARSYRLKAVEYSDCQKELSQREKVRLLDVLRRAGAWERSEGLTMVLDSEELEERLRKVVSFQEELISRRDQDCYKVSDVFASENSQPRQGGPVAQPPPSTIARLRRWMGRHK